MSRALSLLLMASLVPALAPGAAAGVEDDVCVTVNLAYTPPTFSVAPGCLPTIAAPPVPVKVWVDGIPLP